MILPLVLLAIGAVLAGYLNWPGEHLGEFLGKSPSVKGAYTLAIQYGPALVAPANFGQAELPDKDAREAAELLHRNMMMISGAIALLGVLLAYRLHLKDRTAAERLAQRFPEAVTVLDNKYWVDEIYQSGIVEPLRALSGVFFTIDRWVVDGIINLIGFVPQLSGFVLKLTTQRGYLQGYAAAMLFGIAVILLIVFL